MVRKVDLKKELRYLLLGGEARDVTKEHSFDELANHLSSGTISRMESEQGQEARHLAPPTRG